MKQILITAVFISFALSIIAQQPKAVKEEIPVLAWFSIPSGHTSLERYKELKESGITHSLTHDFKNIRELQHALKIANIAGVKMVVTCPELFKEPEKTVKRIMKFPSVAGYSIVDEPGAAAFDSLGKLVKKIRSVDDKHFTYINLLPNYFDPVGAGVSNYEEYVDRYIAEVPTQFLSFDHYPIVNNSLRGTFYANLEIIASKAKKAGKPFWAFALTTAHAPYKVPTVAELRLQVFSNLAYGAQGIQYFTYWLPEGTIWNFHESPITKDSSGKYLRSVVYDRICVVNREIRDLSFVFLGSDILSVYHTGDVLPAGTKRLVDLPDHVKKLETIGQGALVSLIKKSGDHYLVILNRDFTNAMQLDIELNDSVKRVLKDGSIVNAAAYTSKREVDPGDIVIYKW